MIRFCDITLSLFALIILFPLFFPIFIILKFTGEGEIFYCQKRVGFQGKNFYLIKFATMLKDSPNMPGGIMTTKKDPRITPMGEFLRKSKINELPQLFNILLGHMSVVGPRPVMKISFDSYPEEIQKIIYNMKPGLTGIGSIIFRDEEELITNVKNNNGDVWAFYKETIYPFKGELEVWYQKKSSFQLDLILIFVTAYVIIMPESKIYLKIFKDLPIRKF